MATDAAQKHLEVALQEEMCRMFSSEFEGIDTRELTPFVAVMRMIKLEYAYSNPQLYKMLVTVLHDYNPSLGSQHRQMTVKYVRMLLDRSPELADYLVNILPPSATSPASLTEPQHALHALKVTKSGDRGVGKMSIAQDKTFGGKAPIKEEPKYYNCTTPALSAFVANQGVPSKFVTQASRQPPVPRTWTTSESQSDAQTMLATATSVKSSTAGHPSFPLTQGGTVQLLPGSKLVLRSQEGQEVMLAGSATRIQRLPNATVTHVKVPISSASRGVPITATTAPSMVVTTMGTPINVHNMAALKVSPRKHSITLNTSKLKGVQVSELKGDSSSKDAKRKQHLFEKQLHLIKATDILSRREESPPTGGNSDNTRVALRAKIREHTGAPTMTFSTSITSSPQAGPGVSSVRRMQDFAGMVPTLVLPHPASKKASSDRSLSSFPYGQHFTAKMVTEGASSEKDNRFVSDDPLKALQRAANLPIKGQSTAKNEKTKMFASTSRIVQEECISSTNVSTQRMNVDREETANQGSSRASADPESESSQYLDDEAVVLEYIAGRRRRRWHRRQYIDALFSAAESPTEREDAGSFVSASDLEESSSCASQSPTFAGQPQPQQQEATGLEEPPIVPTPTSTPSLWQYHPQAQAQAQPPAQSPFQILEPVVETRKKRGKSGSLKRKRGKE